MPHHQSAPVRIEQLIYIINHAEDRLLFFDLTFLPLVEKLAPHCPRVEEVGAAGWARALARRVGATRPRVATKPCWPPKPPTTSGRYFDENTASSLCYTSGTTDEPKGVLYSHRSTLLHSYAASLPDCFNCGARDVILPVVPMFHVNAWGIPYLAPLNGCKLVLPGPALDAASLYELFETEKVTFSAGVPTIWFGLLNYMREGKRQL